MVINCFCAHSYGFVACVSFHLTNSLIVSWRRTVFGYTSKHIYAYVTSRRMYLCNGWTLESCLKLPLLSHSISHQLTIDSGLLHQAIKFWLHHILGSLVLVCVFQEKQKRVQFADCISIIESYRIKFNLYWSVNKFCINIKWNWSTSIFTKFRKI